MFPPHMKMNPDVPSKKVDTPEFVEEGGAKVDILYYMTNQFRAPILELLGPAVDGLEELIDGYVQKYQGYATEDKARFRRDAAQQELRVKSIQSYFAPIKG